MAGQMELAELVDAAAGVQDDVVAIRRDIHQNPELDLENPRTQGVILEALSGLGYDITKGEALTSVVADLVVDPDKPTVLLRADTDALPMTEDTEETFKSQIEGRAHACGHDSHVAMLLGAARLASENKSSLPVNLRLMFQPGEEGSGGAPMMIEEGVLDGVDRAFAIHVTPNIPAAYFASRPGPIMASADEFEVTVTGKGGHASMPHFAIDPIPAAASMIGDLQSMVTRTIEAFDPGVLTVGQIHSGSTTNVIPESAQLGGTMRAVSEKTRTRLHDGLHRVATNTAAAHNCSCEVTIHMGYPVTINHADAVAGVEQRISETFGEGRYFGLPAPVMGAEDFSYVLQGVPGAMVFLGVCPADIENSFEAPPMHSNRMRLNEDAMPAGVALHLATVLAS